jgi:hypothetical protein
MTDIVVVDFESCFRPFLTDVAEATLNATFHIEEECLDIFTDIARAAINLGPDTIDVKLIEAVCDRLNMAWANKTEPIIVVNKCFNAIVLKLSTILPPSWSRVTMTEHIKNIEWITSTKVAFTLEYD